MVNNEKGIILKVSRLKQYFKIGKSYLKAVHDVSFEVKKGENFGIVGESGCGKTTIGRSIIKLYKITSGDIFFKGQRISAGTRWNDKEIKRTRIRTYEEIKRLKNEFKTDSSKLSKQELEQKISSLKAEAKNAISEQLELIRKAKYDNKYYSSSYIDAIIEKIHNKYEQKIKEANTKQDEEALKKLNKEMDKEIKLAKKENIMTKMQMVFQDPIASINPRMTVREIIAEGLKIQGVRDKKYIDRRVYEMLELVGLVPEHASRYPHEFSGGQRQRIGVARALIMNPELIIADEPVSALDVSVQAQIINLLSDLREKFGITIMFIAHDLSVIKYFCDRICVMYYGNMVELAPADELFKNPLHPYTKSLLSAIPVPDPHFEKQRERIIYNAVLEHDYSVDKPKLREITEEHFILCNEAEFQKYKKQLK